MTANELKLMREAHQPGTAGWYLEQKKQEELDRRLKEYLEQKALDELREKELKRIRNSREVYFLSKILDKKDTATKYELLVWDLCYKGIRIDNPEGLYMAEQVAKSGHGFTDRMWKKFLIKE